MDFELIPTQKYLLNILFSSSTKWLLCFVKVYERDETGHDLFGQSKYYSRELTICIFMSIFGNIRG